MCTSCPLFFIRIWIIFCFSSWNFIFYRNFIYTRNSFIYWNFNIKISIICNCSLFSLFIFTNFYIIKITWSTAFSLNRIWIYTTIKSHPVWSYNIIWWVNTSIWTFCHTWCNFWYCCLCCHTTITRWRFCIVFIIITIRICPCSWIICCSFIYKSHIFTVCTI